MLIIVDNCAAVEKLSLMGGREHLELESPLIGAFSVICTSSRSVGRTRRSPAALCRAKSPRDRQQGSRSLILRSISAAA